MVNLASLARAVGVCLAASCFATTSAMAQTLEMIKQRGTLICGVSQGVLGFSIRSESGQWSGMDVDFCRALAAAIFNDASKVQFQALSATDRFGALQSKRIDVLSRNSTWTMSRETEFDLVFAGVNFYDGQRLMVRRARNVSTALELEGSKICVQAGTTTELSLRDFFKAYGVRYEPVTAPSLDDARKIYEDGRCDVLTADASALHGERLKTTQADEHDILPELLSKEPLGPVVRQDDFRWFNIVKWTNFAMLDAEELGVSSETLNDALKSDQPDVRRLLGLEGSFGERLGLTNDWVARIIRQVGNYVEVYDRNVGAKSRLKIPRGPNALWSNGGILFAPPVR